MTSKSEKSISLLNFILSFIFAMGLIVLVTGVIAYFTMPSYFPVKPSLMVFILSVAAYGCALAICYELIKINNTLILRTPFTMENAKHMEKISIYLFIISAYVLIKDYLSFKTHIFAFTINNNGLITDAEGLVFILLALFVLILSKMFKTAVRIKIENDLTV